MAGNGEFILEEILKAGVKIRLELDQYKEITVKDIPLLPDRTSLMLYRSNETIPELTILYRKNEKPDYWIDCLEGTSLGSELDSVLKVLELTELRL